MSRLIFYVVIGCVIYRMVTDRWPWQSRGQLRGRAGGQVADRQAEARARAVLGLGEGAGRQDILEAHRRVIAAVHPDRGGSNEQVHEANSARETLLARLPHQQQETR